MGASAPIFLSVLRREWTQLVEESLGGIFPGKRVLGYLQGCVTQVC
jgi:hypothetical protein